MFKLVYLFLLIGSNIAGAEFKSNPIIEKAIFRLNPLIDTSSIAKAIESCAINSNTSWKLLLSIAKVESEIKPTAVRKSNGRPSDFGLFQVNVINIKQYKLDRNKLLDPVYNTLSACKIIIDIKKIRKDFIGYYNTGAYSKNYSKRKLYVNKVKKELGKII